MNVVDSLTGESQVALGGVARSMHRIMNPLLPLFLDLFWCFDRRRLVFVFFVVGAIVLSRLGLVRLQKV